MPVARRGPCGGCRPRGWRMADPGQPLARRALMGTFDWQLICLLSFQNTINVMGKQPPIPGIAILRHFAFAITGCRSEIYLYDFNPVSELRAPGTSGSS